MVGFCPLSPISVPPPWPSAGAEIARGDARGLRLAYSSDIAGIGVEAEIDAICRSTALDLGGAGADVEEITFSAADGRAPYQTWRGVWMVGQQFTRLAALDRLGPNLRGNVQAGLKLTARDIAAAEAVRQQVYHRFRSLFERYDALLMPTAPVKPFAVERQFPEAINGRTFESYIDWIAPAFLITLVGLPAASAPAGLTQDGLPVGMQIVAPRFTEPLILRIAALVHARAGVGWPPEAAEI
jgi:amidase